MHYIAHYPSCMQQVTTCNMNREPARGAPVSPRDYQWRRSIRSAACTSHALVRSAPVGFQRAVPIIAK
jgi:hypothetical protein